MDKSQRSPLPLKFYNRDTTTVARELLGQVLVHRLDDGTRLSSRIVETEAYLGVSDKACHTFSGKRTQRTNSMYLPGGHSYIYFIYGMHFCFNVVTKTELDPEAVLIRAVEPIEGIEIMRANRKFPKREVDLTNGPGKLCQAMQILRSADGLRLTDSSLTIEKGEKVADKDIVTASRIGVAYAGEAAEWPLRFYKRGSLYISKLVN